MMEQVLSNKEIELLLEKFEANSKKEENKIDEGPYDFKKPRSITKENIEALKIVYNKYLKQLINYFSELIREPVKGKLVSLMPIDQQDLERMVPKNSTIAGFSCEPLKGEFHTYIPDIFLGLLLEIICGADIEEIAGLMQDRIFADVEITELEMNIAEDIIENIVEFMPSSWESITPIETKMKYVLSHKENSKSLDEGSYLLMATFQLDFSGVKGDVYQCIPFEALETIAEKLVITDKRLNLPIEEKKKYFEEINEALDPIKVNLEIILGNSNMTVKDFLQLEVGDILQLNKHVNSPMDMYVEDKLKYKVISGKQKGNLAIKIVEINEEEEF
jgi:flagellar motor switch protein FliM